MRRTVGRAICLQRQQHQPIPLPPGRPLALPGSSTRRRRYSAVSPAALLRGSSAEHSREALARRQSEWEALRGVMIALQEELDWECYRLYGLLGDDLTQRPKSAKGGGEKENEENLCAFPPLREAFPIALRGTGVRDRPGAEDRPGRANPPGLSGTARRRSPSCHRLAARLPQARRAADRGDRESSEHRPNREPEYKRRWNTEPWHSQLERAMREWLLAASRAISTSTGGCQPPSVLRPLGDIASSPCQAGRRGRPRRRFSPHRRALPGRSGLRRAQAGRRAGPRRERAPVAGPPLQSFRAAEAARVGEDLGVAARGRPARRARQPPPEAIPVPPKYTSADFISSGGARYWALRGKLDVPKERHG